MCKVEQREYTERPLIVLKTLIFPSNLFRFPSP